MANVNPFSKRRKAVARPVEEQRRRIAGLSLRDRFKVNGLTYVLNSISGETAEVTEMATRANITGHDKRGKAVLTEYEYGARILQMPLDTEIE